MTSYLNPKNLHTDNGGVFRNKVIKIYFFNNDHIDWSPYNPQHQGAVEAFNTTIQDFLISAKDHQGEIFCWADSINVYITIT